MHKAKLMSYLKIVFLVYLILLGGFRLHAQENCPLIPSPQKVKLSKGLFSLTRYTHIFTMGDQIDEEAHYLQAGLLHFLDLPVNVSATPENHTANITLAIDNNLATNTYQLQIRPSGIQLSGGSKTALKDAVSSLIQLAMLAKQDNGSIQIACWDIQDYPAFAWRGLMLDESRHFFGKKKLYQILDWMALYKLNRLHWHLTDEPAWRLAIKKYPKLALVGSIGNYANPNEPAQWYSQQDIEDIISYAAKRNITIIPELDMPGHASAAVRAYPEYSGGGSEKHPDFTFDPGNERTYNFLTDILRETNALFPSRMLHLGGDEVSFGSEKWLTKENIKVLMQKQHLSTVKDVETYFMERMADSVFSMNAKLLVWDEMADIDLAREKTIIFWWRHDQPQQLQKALSKAYYTVICPRLPFYFDFVQDSSHLSGRKWEGAFNGLEEVYAYDVRKLVPDSGQRKRILGLQANLWTETVKSNRRLDYLLFPRMAALAETAWTNARGKNFEMFTNRLAAHIRWYRNQGIYYYDPFTPEKTPEPIE